MTRYFSSVMTIKGSYCDFPHPRLHLSVVNVAWVPRQAKYFPPKLLSFHHMWTTFCVPGTIPNILSRVHHALSLWSRNIEERRGHLIASVLLSGRQFHVGVLFVVDEALGRFMWGFCLWWVKHQAGSCGGFVYGG